MGEHDQWQKYHSVYIILCYCALKNFNMLGAILSITESLTFFATDTFAVV